MSSDQRASLLGIIEAEKSSVAHYTRLLREAPAHPLARRWRGLKAWHQGQIKARRKELRTR